MLRRTAPDGRHHAPEGFQQVPDLGLFQLDALQLFGQVGRAARKPLRPLLARPPQLFGRILEALVFQ